ncbi:Reticulocyte-binding protein 2-like protein a [Ooceraea biroi]|uniref:Reticulocyte-binding protein 2-like protein a n=1 Tax=Ooceraea biroi TaxID=2015173 RepID=A0A026WWK7_OOCBI|nr:Reticulocyte-binding protein 2-like protein a [Ooceraea biroi]
MERRADRYGAREMRHSRSEDLLGTISRSPSPIVDLPTTTSEDDLIAASALRESGIYDEAVGGMGLAGPSRRILSSPPRAMGVPVDPEDSIRDIVTENDLYRYVLFKRHYDKYVDLSEKYKEAKSIAYYLEERYHEIKAERDKLEEARRNLERRLEGCETELRGKEDELFLQLERSLRLEEEVERAKAERDSYLEAQDRLEQQRESAFRRLQMQLEQNEITRRDLERARQDVIRQATVIRAERDTLERENEVLRQRLRLEQDELGAERRRREEGVAALTRETIALKHATRHLTAATFHATSCRNRRRCSICTYARHTFATVDNYRDNGKLLQCLQTPLQDLRSWLRPSATSSAGTSRVPRIGSTIADREICYIDDSSVDSSSNGSTNSRSCSSSTSSSNSAYDDEAYPSTPIAEPSLSSATSSVPHTARAFSSDSGFSSEIGDRRSRCFENIASSTSSSSGKSRNISESLDSNEVDDQGGVVGRDGLVRSRWTSSFRRLLGRKPKSKLDRSAGPSKTDESR